MSRFDRQTCVPGVGDEGQERLKRSSVLVVGAGGTGSPVIQYLAGAGIGRLNICDFDRVDETNLHRQVLYTDRDVGEPKAYLARLRCRAVGVEGMNYEAPFADVPSLHPYDVILDCTDRWSAHDEVIQAGRRAGIPVVHGAIQGLLGRIMVFAPGGPCWRCLHPEKPNLANAIRGTLGPVCGIIGSMMAFEAMRLLLGWEPVFSQMLVYDAKAAHTTKFKLTVRPDCPEHA